MSLIDKVYEAYWSASGLVRPVTTSTYLRQRREADKEWKRSRPEKLTDLGTVERLSILPLVEFYAADSIAAAGEVGGADGGAAGENGTVTQPAYVTESGVSYLVKVDDRTILFDVGYNQRGEHPSPLLRNMEALGVAPSEFDAVMISHIHLDHVGGPQNQAARTFSLSAQDVDLRGIPAYVPAPMSHPTASVEVVTEGRKLYDGVASTGPLTRAIWLMGPAVEQSLIVNVKDKGVVLIIGCGHPSLYRIVQRALDLVDAPLYGVIGGLHFPVTGSRVGKGRQNIIGSGKLPWQRITKREARKAAAALAQHDPGLIALSGHDSCDWTMDMFKKTLGPRYRTVRVDDEIVVA